MKKNKKRMARIEKLLIATVLCVALFTPIAVLTLSSISFSYTKETSKVESELASVKQEVNELEVKKQEKLTYDRVQGFAAEGGLAINRDRVKSVS